MPSFKKMPFKKLALASMALLFLPVFIAALDPIENLLPPVPPKGPSGTFHARYVDFSRGNDGNDGTINAPYKNIATAVNAMSPGDITYLRGGKYPSANTSFNLADSGSTGKYFYIWAYPGERPIIDFESVKGSHKVNGFNITGSYWYLKGLEIMRADKSGIRIGSNGLGGSYNIVENCSIHDNNDAGVYIGTNKGVSQDGYQAAFNQIINCDSYLNCDLGGSTGDGGNADGFACKLNPGAGNVFRGCRSWENSDDAFDFYMANYRIIVDRCWVWNMGDVNSFREKEIATYGSFEAGVAKFEGNGNGFKLGGGDAKKKGEHYAYGHHLITNCIAFNIKAGKGSVHKAYDRNNNHGGVSIYNSLAFYYNPNDPSNTNTYGFSFDTKPDDGTNHLIANSVEFGTAHPQTFYPGIGETTNSWNLGITVGLSDFEPSSLTEAAAKAPRDKDGNLPSTFARLLPSSKLNGLATDLGYGKNLGAQ